MSRLLFAGWFLFSSRSLAKRDCVGSKVESQNVAGKNGEGTKKGFVRIHDLGDRAQLALCI